MEKGLGRRFPRKAACSENVPAEVGGNFFPSYSGYYCISVPLELHQHFQSGSDLSLTVFMGYLVFQEPKELNFQNPVI